MTHVLVLAISHNAERSEAAGYSLRPTGHESECNAVDMSDAAAVRTSNEGDRAGSNLTFDDAIGCWTDGRTIILELNAQRDWRRCADRVAIAIGERAGNEELRGQYGHVVMGDVTAAVITVGDWLVLLDPDETRGIDVHLEDQRSAGSAQKRPVTLSRHRDRRCAVEEFSCNRGKRLPLRIGDSEAVRAIFIGAHFASEQTTGVEHRSGGPGVADGDVSGIRRIWYVVGRERVVRVGAERFVMDDLEDLERTGDGYCRLDAADLERVASGVFDVEVSRVGGAFERMVVVVADLECVEDTAAAAGNDLDGGVVGDGGKHVAHLDTAHEYRRARQWQKRPVDEDLHVSEGTVVCRGHIEHCAFDLLGLTDVYGEGHRGDVVCGPLGDDLGIALLVDDQVVDELHFQDFGPGVLALRLVAVDLGAVAHADGARRGIDRIVPSRQVACGQKDIAIACPVEPSCVGIAGLQRVVDGLAGGLSLGSRTCRDHRNVVENLDGEHTAAERHLVAVAIDRLDKG